MMVERVFVVLIVLLAGVAAGFLAPAARRTPTALLRASEADFSWIPNQTGRVAWRGRASRPAAALVAGDVGRVVRRGRRLDASSWRQLVLRRVGVPGLVENLGGNQNCMVPSRSIFFVCSV